MKMWKKLKIDGVNEITKLVAEFEVWIHALLPYGKMKIKIYENTNGTFAGRTDVRLKRKFDGTPESAVGYGHTMEEALSETIRWFKEMVAEDYPKDQYPDGLTGEEIEYSDFSDF